MKKPSAVPAITLHTDAIQKVKSDGFAFLPKFRPGDLDENVFNELGRIDHLPGLKDIQELRPTSISTSTPNTYSGNFGFCAFPFHSDMAHWPTPPRMLVLRCVKGRKGVATRLLDSTALVREIGESRLRKTLVKPRRPLEMTFPLMRLRDRHKSGEELFRWDSIFLIAASDQSVSTCHEVEEWIHKSIPVEVELLELGDTLVIDNWRMLHARSPVPPGCEDRVIRRVYLSHFA